MRVTDVTVPTASHSALDPPPASDGVDLVHEDDTRLVVLGVVEHLADQTCRLADVFVDDCTRHNLGGGGEGWSGIGAISSPV